jgi:integrase
VRADALGHSWGLLRVWGKTTGRTGELRLFAVPPTLARAIERLRRLGLHAEWVFPRPARRDGELVTGRWTTEALDNRVAKWRKRAGLPGDFQLYSMRHRGYTLAVGHGGLTADQAGQVGGTRGNTVRAVYLQEDLAALISSADAVRRAQRSGGK